MHTICVPLYIDLPKKKKKDRFYLNLNAYRNTHFFKLNKAKELYEDLVEKMLVELPKMLKVELTFKLFLGSARSADLSNICSIVDKFFCDALVNSGKIPDDNYDVISSVNYQFGGVDKTNPRVEVCITPITNAEDETMQITIVQTEIETAIRNYIKSQITVNDNQKIDIELRATRGAEGFQAMIDIVPVEVSERSVAAVVKQAATASEGTGQNTPVIEVAETAQIEEPKEEVVEPTTAKGVDIELDDEGNPVKPAGAPKSIFGSLKKTTENNASA